jgi:uncharacterized protein YccT (UPF0319 family)
MSKSLFMKRNVCTYDRCTQGDRIFFSFEDSLKETYNNDKLRGFSSLLLAFDTREKRLSLSMPALSIERHRESSLFR